jgi:hypothetical protein
MCALLPEMRSPPVLLPGPVTELRPAMTWLAHTNDDSETLAVGLAREGCMVDVADGECMHTLTREYEECGLSD